MTDPITSTTNPRIKDLVKLRSRRHRDRSGRFLIEGFREITRATEAGLDFDTLFVAPDLYLGTNEPALVERVTATGAAVLPVSEDPFRKASYRDRPDGLLAVARQFATDLDGLSPAADQLLLVAEAIEKPGNLGTMLRTADAAGASIIVCDPTTDPFNPNVVRASVGTLFTVPLAVASTDEVILHLRSIGVKTIATTPDTDGTIFDRDLTGAVAIVVGSEQYGLSDRWLEAANHWARIPMAGHADSLNAAVAAAVALYEAVRQRRS